MLNQKYPMYILANKVDWQMFEDSFSRLYYFWGGWSKWGFPTDADWFKAMQTFSNKLQSPLKVEIK